jgi:hypothetical protein
MMEKKNTFRQEDGEQEYVQVGGCRTRICAGGRM